MRDVMVEGDVARLTQVFANLLSNATTFSPDGASLELVVDRHAQHAVVTVRDAGIGFEPDAIDRVFDLFVQARPGYDAASGGLGIGLSLARHLVEMRGGGP